MSLGVLNNLNAMYAENNLNNTSNSLSTVLNQLSSGSKINSGADDAAGLSLVDGLQANSMALTQSTTNAQEGVGLLTVADGALSQVTNLLNRAVTLATEASNGTLTGSQDTAANQEYQSILSEVNNIGTTTTYNQQTVFGSATNIYTGDSSAQGSSIDALNIRSLSSANLGDTAGVMSYSNGSSNVFVNLSNDGNNASITDSLGAANATTTINVSYLTKGAGGSTVSASAPISVGAGTTYGNNTQGLISAINNSGLGLTATFATASQAGSAAVTAAEAAGGAGTDTGIEISAAGIGSNTAGSNGVGVVGALSLASGDTLGGTLSIVGADGASHNINLGTGNSTDTLQNLASTINAAGYGVTASLNQAQTQLTFTSATPGVSVTGTNLSQNTVPSAPQNIMMTNSGLGSLTVGNQADTLTGTLSLTSGVNGQTTQLQLGTSTGNAKTDTLANLAQTITNGGYGITATVTNGTTLTFTNGTGNANPAAVSGSNIVDVAAPSISAGSTLGSLSVASAGDTLATSASDNLTIKSGTTGIQSTLLLGKAGTTDTLANLAQTINSGNYGITASLDKTGTDLTFVASSGNTYAAGVTGTGLDNTYPTTLISVTPNTTLGSITLNGPNDQVEGITINSVKSTADGGGPGTGLGLLSNAKAETLAQIATDFNQGAQSGEGITATLSNNGNTLTFTGGAGASVTPSGTYNDITPSGAVTASVVNNPGSGNLGTLSVTSATDMVTGNLNITSGTSTFGGSIAIHGSAGQTLSQIAADFNATDETTTSQNGGTALNNLGIHAQLSTDGTQIVFSQLSGTTNNLQAASVSTGTYSSPQVTDLTALTSSLTTSAPGDTLTGTLSGEKSDGSGTYSYSFADLTSSQIAANFNNTGSSNWSAAGISAAVNNSGNGNTITFTATGTGTISDNGSIVDTVGTKNVGESVSSAVVAGATLTATGSNSLLSGTLAGVGADGSTAWSQKFTDQTVAQIAAYFTANVGTIGIDVTVGGAGNNVITFAQDAGNSGTATFGTSAGPLTDVTPASQLTSTPQVVAGATLGALTATNAGDTLTGNLTVTSGITGKQSNLQLGISGQTDTLANLANTITNGGYGITAALNTSANSVAGTAAGTVLTFTQTAGDANTAAITNNGVVLDTAAAVSNPSLNVTAAGGGNIGTLTATSTSDILNGTLNLTEGNDALGNQTAYTITGQTLSEIAASFNAPGGANSGLGITAALNTSISNGNAVGTVLTFTSTGSHTAAVSGTGITDTTPATTINQTVAPGTILNTVTVANKADTLTGDFSLRQGLTSSVAAAGDIALSQGQTLAQIADDFNGGSGTGDATDKAALDVMGIHADLNAAGTELILTQEIGDKGTAIANTSTTSLVDTAGASTAATQSFGGDTLANTITVGASTDTLVGTLNIQEGVDTNKTASTYNLNGQTIAQVAAAFNTGAEKDLGILASVNNDVLTFSQASSDLGTAKVTASSSSIGDQAAATQTAQNVASGTMLDTLSVNSASDLLGGTLNLTSGVSGTAVPAITLGTKGTTDTLANLATTITNGGYGITATLNTARTELIFTQNSGGFSASVSSPSVTDSKSVSGVTPSTSLGTLTVSNSSDQLTGTLTGVEGDGQTAYSSIKLTGQTLAELASTINVTDAAYGITAQLNQAGTSLSFTATAGDTGAPTIGNVGSISDLTPAGMTSISLTNQPSAGQGYYSLGISGNVNDTSTAVTASGKTTYGGTANVGIATNHNGSSGTATISYSDAAGQSLSSTDLSNATDAQATLKALNAAITDVAAQDGYVGAQINTLNAVSSVLSTQQENVVSAQNAVQATDYAQAASNMSKYQILSQTGISALAQANSMQQEVTKLLQ